MTFDQFIGAVNAIHLDNIVDDESHRYGQTFFNYLARIKPGLAEAIRATSLDPFYRDDVSSDTFAFCSENWGNHE